MWRGRFIAIDPSLIDRVATTFHACRVCLIERCQIALLLIHRSLVGSALLLTSTNAARHDTRCRTYTGAVPGIAGRATDDGTRRGSSDGAAYALATADGRSGLLWRRLRCRYGIDSC
jgi:hypothetical protein